MFISENHGNLMMRTAGMKLSANVHGSIPDLSSRPSFSNEFAETGVPTDNDDKLHLFGLLMSEIRGSHMRFSQSSNLPSNIETQSNDYRRNICSNSNGHQGAINA